MYVQSFSEIPSCFYTIKRYVSCNKVMASHTRVLCPPPGQKKSHLFCVIFSTKFRYEGGVTGNFFHLHIN